MIHTRSLYEAGNRLLIERASASSAAGTTALPEAEAAAVEVADKSVRGKWMRQPITSPSP